jgi:hypothetical protein
MNVMQRVSIRLAGMIVVLAVLAALMLGGAGAAIAACSYSMTSVSEVQPGSTNAPIGSLVITLDAATASGSAGSFVDLSLPAQPSGFGLAAPESSLIDATGSVSVTNIDQRTVRVAVYSLNPSSGGSVQIVLPLTVSVPEGYNGNIILTALAPPGSVFSSSNDLTPASLGTATLRVDPDSVDFGGVATGSVSSLQILTASDIGASSLSISSDSITGPNAGDFQVSQDNCSGQTLANGQHATLGVIFTPSAAGARQAVLHFFSSDPYVLDYQVNLAGTGLAAAGGVIGTAVFKIGASSFTVNGTVYKTDVAPYIKDGRTFLPLRYIANAAGIADSGIMWDPATQEVTISKGERLVQVTIGSTTMLINGQAITMDVAPEITDGRTCLPMAWVAQALGASITWDATAQTVTITF